MSTLNRLTPLDSLSQPRPISQNSLPKHATVANSGIPIRRVESADRLRTYGNYRFGDPVEEALDLAIELEELRNAYVCRLKEEIAAGRYNVAASKLAERLLQIAERDLH